MKSQTRQMRKSTFKQITSNINLNLKSLRAVCKYSVLAIEKHLILTYVSSIDSNLITVSLSRSYSRESHNLNDFPLPDKFVIYNFSSFRYI